MLNKIFKSKAFACVVTGFVTFIVGFSIGCVETDEVKTMRAEYPRQQVEIEKLQDEVKELTEKLVEAQPFFDMKEEEQAQLEAQLEKEKKAREEAEAKAKAEAEAKAKAEAEAKKQAELEAKTVTLGNGNFEAGVDFEAGSYDIIAISGGGNVISSNMFDGGINAVMGVDQSFDFYEKEYKNIKLPQGTTLKVDGVEIKLVPRD